MVCFTVAQRPLASGLLPFTLCPRFFPPAPRYYNYCYYYRYCCYYYYYCYYCYYCRYLKAFCHVKANRSKSVYVNQRGFYCVTMQISLFFKKWTCCLLGFKVFCPPYVFHRTASS